MTETKLIFKRLSSETDSACVALLKAPDGETEFVGIVAKNICGWAVYNTDGDSVTDSWKYKSELHAAVLKSMEMK